MKPVDFVLHFRGKANTMQFRPSAQAVQATRLNVPATRGRYAVVVTLQEQEKNRYRASRGFRSRIGQLHSARWDCLKLEPSPHSSALAPSGFPEFRTKTEISDLAFGNTALNWSFSGKGCKTCLWHRHCFKRLWIRLLRAADGRTNRGFGVFRTVPIERELNWNNERPTTGRSAIRV